jgi:carboxyvinyl-carboxyphosphonate phosphorylmutase
MADRDRLASHQVRICLQGHQPFGAAVGAVHHTLKAQRGRHHAAETRLPALLKQLTRQE